MPHATSETVEVVAVSYDGTDRERDGCTVHIGFDHVGASMVERPALVDD